VTSSPVAVGPGEPSGEQPIRSRRARQPRDARRCAQSGVSLIEVAIVLVVIGLLLGGILKGQEMVTQARVKNVVNDFNGFTAAYFGYHDRYRAIPGDDAAAAGRWSAVASAGGGSCDGPKNGTGNGILSGPYSAPPPPCGAFTVDGTTGESLNFWWHLRLAGFVAGAVSGQAAWTQPLNAVGGMVGVQNGAPGSGVGAPGLSGLVLCSANVPDKIASAVDTALDDQRSQTGLMFGYPQGAASNPDIDGTTPIYAAPNYVETGSSQYVICKKI
jgi:prepilin-type N-terminal cleavage/methylation domain-containing protein